MFLKYIVEFIGTFILLSVILIHGSPIPIGIALACALFIGGAISGGHFNPAVSLMMYLKRAISLNDTVIYIIFQILAGITALTFYKASL